ncbi:hypothetical protein OSTOST_00800 [Ostertagia ostertagi]
MEKTCGVTNLQVFDYTGMPYSFSVPRVEYLTEPLQRSKLSEEDKRYLVNHDIELSVNPYAKEIQPEILLGHWLAKLPVNKDAGVLVRNRILEIRKIAADIQKPIRWPKRQQRLTLPQDIDGEVEEIKICLVGVESRDDDKELIDWNRHNSLSTTQQTVALALRFLRRPNERVSHVLSSRLQKNIPALEPRKEYQYVTAERDEALHAIVQNHQAIHVTEQLRKSIKSLNPSTSNRTNKGFFAVTDNPRRTRSPRWLQYLLTFLFGTSYGKSLQCVKGGVQIVSNGESQYEICAEGHCVVTKHPLPNDTLFFPPEITLHDHRVQRERLDGRKIEVIETTCPAIPFCDNVQCWFCTANAFNPEYSPIAALMVWTVTFYMAIAVIYTICYVPLTVGKPCRILHEHTQRHQDRVPQEKPSSRESK